jgi:hypothetical protein
MGAMARSKTTKPWNAGLLSASLLLALLFLSACSPGGESLEVGATAPDFTAAATDGSTVSLSDYKNESPVLLFFHMAVG